MDRDEHIYAYIMEELENGIKDEALWIKAYAISEGVEERIKPLYMQYRVNFIKKKYNALCIDYAILEIIDIRNFVKNDFKDDSWIEKLWKWAEKGYIEERGYYDNRYHGYNKDEYTGIPKDKDELLSLKNLHIRCTDNLEELPREIGNLTNLTGLKIDKGVSLQELPKEICNLINLTKLEINDCILLQELPKEIGNLINLTHLYFENTNFEKLPKEICTLTKLEEFAIDNNKSLKELPEEIGNLTSLKGLIIEKCYMEVIPKEIGNLINLEYLSLNNTIFKYFPDELCNLTNLETLSIYNEHLNLTKKQYEWMKTLKKGDIKVPIYPHGLKINIVKNEYSELWKNMLEGWASMQMKNEDQGDSYTFEFNNFSKESKIYIYINTTIMKIPDELKYLTNLTNFTIKGRIPLLNISKELFNHVNLKTIIINDSLITELPNEIGNLENLEYLSLLNNNLTELPKEIGNLKKLETLILSSNRDLKLTQEEKKLIKELSSKPGSLIYIDNDLLDRN